MKSFVATLFTALIAFTTLHAEGAQEALPPAEQGFFQTFSMIAIAMVMFYFILWRPEQKRRKATEAQRSNMKKGDRAIAMGIIGTVYKVSDQSVTLQMVDGNKIEVLKAAISEVTPVKESQ